MILIIWITTTLVTIIFITVGLPFPLWSHGFDHRTRSKWILIPNRISSTTSSGRSPMSLTRIQSTGLLKKLDMRDNIFYIILGFTSLKNHTTDDTFLVGLIREYNIFLCTDGIVELVHLAESFLTLDGMRLLVEWLRAKFPSATRVLWGQIKFRLLLRRRYWWNGHLFIQM